MIVHRVRCGLSPARFWEFLVRWKLAVHCTRGQVARVRIPIGPGAVHVERYGFGDRPVVLLHGFGTSGFLWRNVAPALPLGRVTAFAADLFGWGESDRSLEADYGVGAQADYLDRALTVLRVARADVVAVDLGCAVALALAARRPARVRSMVLVNPSDPSASPPRAEGAARRRCSGRYWRRAWLAPRRCRRRWWGDTPRRSSAAMACGTWCGAAPRSTRR